MMKQANINLLQHVIKKSIVYRTLLDCRLAKRLSKAESRILQGVTGVVESSAKRYCKLMEIVKRAMKGYSRTAVLTHMLMSFLIFRAPMIVR